MKCAEGFSECTYVTGRLTSTGCVCCDEQVKWFVVLKAGFISLLPSWDVMPCNVADMYEHFRGISCLLHQSSRLGAW